MGAKKYFSDLNKEKKKKLVECVGLHFHKITLTVHMLPSVSLRARG